MNTDYTRISRELTDLLGSELAEIIKAIGNDEDIRRAYSVELPEKYSVDQGVEELSELVAISANQFGRIARLAGMARAHLVLVRAEYNRKFKVSRFGNNDKEREANGILAASEEYNRVATVEAIVELAEGLEANARIKSESTRKILDKVQKMRMAQDREAHGNVSDRYFSPY